MRRKHGLRRMRGHVSKDRPPTRNPYTGHARQVKDIEGIQKQFEYAWPSNHGHAVIWLCKCSPRLLEGRTGRIPEERPAVRGNGGDGGNASGHDHASARRRMRQLLLRVSAVNHNIDFIQTALKEMLVGVDPERRRYDAFCGGQHAVFGNDGISLDMNWWMHDSNSPATRPDSSNVYCAVPSISTSAWRLARSRN